MNLQLNKLLSLIFFLLSLVPCLVKAQDYPEPIIKGLPKDSALSDSMKTMVLASHDEAYCTINKVYNEFYDLVDNYEAEALDSAWNAHPDFPLWMGRCHKDPEFYEELGERISTLHDWLANHQITYQLRLGAFSYCELTHSTAYTSQLSRNKVINLCPYWLRCRSKQKAATIIHELVHKMGFGHPEGTTFPSKAIILARVDPHKACKSPENFEGLAESFYCSETP